jgi:hypothetical protein
MVCLVAFVFISCVCASCVFCIGAAYVFDPYYKAPHTAPEVGDNEDDVLVAALKQTVGHHVTSIFLSEELPVVLAVLFTLAVLWYLYGKVKACCKVCWRCCCYQEEEKKKKETSCCSCCCSKETSTKQDYNKVLDDSVSTVDAISSHPLHKKNGGPVSRTMRRDDYHDQSDSSDDYSDYDSHEDDYNEAHNSKHNTDCDDADASIHSIDVTFVEDDFKRRVSREKRGGGDGERGACAPRPSGSKVSRIKSRYSSTSSSRGAAYGSRGGKN